MDLILLRSGLGRAGVETLLVVIPLGVYALARWFVARGGGRGVARRRPRARRKRLVRGR
jgi:hypothetical protein